MSTNYARNYHEEDTGAYDAGFEAGYTKAEADMLKKRLRILESIQRKIADLMGDAELLSDYIDTAGNG